MKVGICNDHAALDLKNLVVEHLEKQGYEVVNYGTNTPDSFDYPLAATALCRGLQSKEVELGIAICATGVGIPPEGIALILPIDHFCDMARSMTNVLGNALSTVAVDKWEGHVAIEQEFIHDNDNA